MTTNFFIGLFFIVLIMASIIGYSIRTAADALSERLQRIEQSNQEIAAALRALAEQKKI